MMRHAPIWIALLVLSVLVNGILIGVLIQRGAGPGFEPHARHGEMHRPGRFHPEAFLAALPEETRERARERLREGRRDMLPLMREAARARREAARALSADPFDAEAAASALAEARAARAAMEARGEAVLLSIVEDLDPQTAPGRCQPQSQGRRRSAPVVALKQHPQRAPGLGRQLQAPHRHQRQSSRPGQYQTTARLAQQPRTAARHRRERPKLQHARSFSLKGDSPQHRPLRRGKSFRQKSPSGQKL